MASSRNRIPVPGSERAALPGARMVGYLNPVLYSLPTSAGAFRDIMTGNNGAYPAGLGWDACTGWGSPDGAKLLSTLSSKQ